MVRGESTELIRSLTSLCETRANVIKFAGTSQLQNRER
jgi:hypothetical protein